MRHDQFSSTINIHVHKKRNYETKKQLKYIYLSKSQNKSPYLQVYKLVNKSLEISITFLEREIGVRGGHCGNQDPGCLPRPYDTKGDRQATTGVRMQPQLIVYLVFWPTSPEMFYLYLSTFLTLEQSEVYSKYLGYKKC